MDTALVNENNENLWTFEILSGINFKNCEHIHPLKQKEVQQLVNACKSDSGIDLLIIFGSSVEFRCRSNSDIDCVLIRNDNKKIVPDTFYEIHSEVDIFLEVFSRLKDTLYKHGVVVYRRCENV